MWYVVREVLHFTAADDLRKQFSYIKLLLLRLLGAILHLIFNIRNSLEQHTAVLVGWGYHRIQILRFNTQRKQALASSPSLFKLCIPCMLWW